MSGSSVMVMGAASGSILNPFNAGLHASGTAPGSATCTLRLDTDGSCNYGSNDSVGPPSWFVPVSTGIGSLYWVKLHKDSGDNLTVGTMDTVLALTSNRLWQLTKSGAGSLANSCTITFYSDAAGTLVVASGTVSFGVDVV